MSDESTVGREPVEIVEILTPKCVNVHGAAPCTATQTGNGKCFNTRATCNDVDNYQARPLSHLTADQLYIEGDTVAAADLTTDASFMLEFEGWLGADLSGTIFGVGGAGDGDHLYLGFTGDDFVFSVGGTGGQTRITVDKSEVAGSTCTIIAAYDDTTDEIALFRFCNLSLRLRELGRATAGGGTWASATDGEVGDSAEAYTGEDGGPLEGASIDVVRWHDDQFIALDTDPEAYRQRYFFDDGRGAKPSDPIYILPMLAERQTVGTRLNVGGSDDRYEPLGRRAFMEASFVDAPHSDYPFDPYRTDREYDPLKRSTFWAKWLQRNKFGKTRGLVRVYSGYNGQSLSQMRRQTYVLDAVDWARDSVALRCRDFLSLTEFRRAQVPEASPGRLDSVLNDTATSLDLVGDQREAYPAAGTLRIADEIMTYSGGLTYDSLTDTTTISNLTRGTDGSSAEEHDVDEGVQLCRRYTAARVDDVLTDLLLNDARIPAQAVDLAGLFSETENSLLAYSLTTLISEPTGVDQLIGEIAEQCSFYIWWDERDQLVRFQAIKPLIAVAKTFQQDVDIIADTFELVERPKERITTISGFYNPRNFADDLTKPTNYENQLVVSNSSASAREQYGELPQTREVFSRWLTTNAQMNQTLSRYSVRYAEVPRYARFMVDAKDRAIWVGDFVSISHDFLVDARGNLDTRRRWLVIEAEEVEPGHAQKLHCVDVTLDGLIYVITENGLPNYTPALFDAGNAFITNNDGTNPDGSQGATIG